MYQAKKAGGYNKVTFPTGGNKGLSGDCATDAGQEIPDWFQIPFLGQPKL